MPEIFQIYSGVEKICLVSPTIVFLNILFQFASVFNDIQRRHLIYVQHIRFAFVFFFQH